MLAKTIEYEDFNGLMRKETFYFHLSEAELMEMELTTEGGLTATYQKIVDAKDVPSLVKIFKDLIFKSYGEKSADGRQFNKSEALSLAFSHTNAYNKLFMELAMDSEKAANFLKGIMPDNISSEMDKQNLPAAIQ